MHLIRKTSERDRVIAQRIRAMRIERGLTQHALADKLGLSFQQLQKYEQGRNRVSAGRLAQIAEIFRLDVAYFFNGLTGGRNKPDESAALLQTPGALELLRCYAGINSRRRRSKLVNLARALT
jgi:transcriptional regulator with XRE-family HTH domain